MHRSFEGPVKSSPWARKLSWASVCLESVLKFTDGRSAKQVAVHGHEDHGVRDVDALCPSPGRRGRPREVDSGR